VRQIGVKSAKAVCYGSSWTKSEHGFAPWELARAGAAVDTNGRSLAGPSDGKEIDRMKRGNIEEYR
jgi:hypothetical protein